MKAGSLFNIAKITQAIARKKSLPDSGPGISAAPEQLLSLHLGGVNFHN